MKTSTKIWIVITGVIFIIFGIVCMCNPIETLVSMAWLIGLFTLMSGFSKLFFGLKTQNELPNSGTRILTGLLDVIFGIFFLGNSIFVAASLPVIFAIWLIIEGVIIAVQSFDYKSADYKGWWGILLLGIAGAILGIFALKNPVAAGATLSFIFGFSVMLFGIAYLVAFFGINKFQKKVKKVKNAVRDAIDEYRN